MAEKLDRTGDICVKLIPIMRMGEYLEKIGVIMVASYYRQ